MKELLRGGILLFWIGNLFAQTPDTLWTRTYGGGPDDQGMSAQQTYDDGYIIAGYTYSGSGLRNVYLIKTDENGDSVWARIYGGSDNDFGYSVQQTSDSGYIIVGKTKSFGAGDFDVYLIKTDPDGDTLWTRTYGAAFADEGRCVREVPDGGYIIAGWTDISGTGDREVYLIRTDSGGGVIWTKTFGEHIAEGRSVALTSDSGYVVSGYIVGTGPSIDMDVWLIKTDSNGDTLWHVVYGEPEWNDCGEDVIQTSDGGYIVCGWTDNYLNGLGYDIYLIKTNSNGNLQWKKTLGEDHDDYGYSVKEISDGGYIIAGGTDRPPYNNSDVYLVRTDTNGDTLWTVAYGDNWDDCGRLVQQTSDSGYIIAGYMDVSYGCDDHDVYLIKTGPEVGIEDGVSSDLTDIRIPGLVYGNLLKLSGINNHTEVEIFDILGREILNQEATPQKSYIRLNNLTSGVYFLSIKKEKPELHKFVLIR